MRTLLAALRFTLFMAWTLALMPFYLLILGFGGPVHRILPIYHGVVLRWCLGGRVEVRGMQTGDRPLLVVANHASYVDIVVLGSLIPGSFVSKAEVRGWPGIGFLARLSRTVFVDRRPGASGKARDQIAERLRARDTLILFPEGTSSDGNRVLPFKTALFNVAEKAVDGRPPLVQPVAVAYTHARGLPMGVAGRPAYAWYGDMDLAPHLWELMRAGSFTVQVEFLEPVAITSFTDRKTLARHCETTIREAFGRAMTGRSEIRLQGKPAAGRVMPADA